MEREGDGGGLMVHGGWQCGEEVEMKLWVEFGGSRWCIAVVGRGARNALLVGLKQRKEGVCCEWRK